MKRTARLHMYSRLALCLFLPGDFLNAIKREQRRNRSITTGGVKLEAGPPPMHMRGSSLNAPVNIASQTTGLGAPPKVHTFTDDEVVTW
jgi:hypothetical protein